MKTAAWAMLALSSATWVAVFAPPLAQPGPVVADVIWGIPYVAFALVGAIIIRRQPANGIGWMLSGIGLCMGLAGAELNVLRLLYASPNLRGLVPWLMVLQPAALVAFGLIVLLVLTFPDGRLPSPRWKWFLIFLALFLGVVAVDQVVTPVQQTSGLPVSALANPDLARVLDPLTSFNLNGAFLLAAAVGLAFRYRSGNAVARQQIKGFAVSV